MPLWCPSIEHACMHLSIHHVPPSHVCSSSSQSIRYSLSSSALRLEPLRLRSRTLWSVLPLRHPHTKQEIHLKKPHPLVSTSSGTKTSEFSSSATLCELICELYWEWWSGDVEACQGSFCATPVSCGCKDTSLWAFWCRWWWGGSGPLGLPSCCMWSSRASLNDCMMSLDAMALLLAPSSLFSFFSTESAAAQCVVSHHRTLHCLPRAFKYLSFPSPSNAPFSRLSLSGGGCSIFTVVEDSLATTPAAGG